MSAKLFKFYCLKPLRGNSEVQPTASGVPLIGFVCACICLLAIMQRASAYPMLFMFVKKFMVAGPNRHIAERDPAVTIAGPRTCAHNRIHVS